MRFKKEFFKQAALYLFNAVKVFIKSVKTSLFRDSPPKNAAAHRAKKGKSSVKSKRTAKKRFIKVPIIHKLRPVPWKSILKKVKSFCKKTIFAVKKIVPAIKTADTNTTSGIKNAAYLHISPVKRMAQGVVLLAKHPAQYIPVLAKRITQRIVLVSRGTARFIVMLAKRIPPLAKRTAQCFLLLAKYVWPAVKIILPPLITGALVFAALNGSGLVRAMIDDLAPVTGFVPAALLLLLISLIPVISPLVGPGIIIAVLAVILTGEQIAAGAVTPLMALPAFCAIDVLIGGKIIPRAFALGETEPETIDAGVPVIFFTRLITIPAAVAVAYLFSFILFQS